MTDTTTPDVDGTTGLDLDDILPAATADGVARRAALEAWAETSLEATSLVDYDADDRVVVVGPEEPARAAAQRLAELLRCTVLVPLDAQAAAPTAPASDAAPPVPASGAEGGAAQRAASANGSGAPLASAPLASAPLASATGISVIRAAVTGISGHLGAFHVSAMVDGDTVQVAPSLMTGNRPFDLVLDLCDPPFITHDVLPPGYYAPVGAEALERALDELPEMTGEFQKPKYFAYDPEICAHGARGVIGCTRCLEACPTGAIVSVGERVEVDSHLCQGGGTCASVCPSGAMTYAYPAPADLLHALRRGLTTYRQCGGRHPVVLFYDAEAGFEWLHHHGGSLPEHVLPFEVEEIGSVGLDAWLAAIAYGAWRVRSLALPSTPPTVIRALERQQETASAILAGLGLAGDGLSLLPGHDPAQAVAALGNLPQPEDAGFAAVGRPATFAATGEKRTDLRLALDHLYEQAPAAAEITPLPDGAPFGSISVDASACTLCMACASVCPASAVLAGGESPRLDFVEWNCLQCGICERACPEDAIILTPRLINHPEARRRRRLLNEDRPFHCVSCGKVFGSTSVIARMQEKLAGHWMFDTPEALRRLKMCEDCRVQDMFGGEGPDGS